MQVAEPYVQQSFMFNCMDDDVTTLLCRKIKEDTSLTKCMEKIRELFLEKNPLIVRHLDLFSQKQPEGILFTSWWAKMTQMRKECDQLSMTAEDHWLNFLKCNMYKGDLQQKFLRLDAPDEEKVLKIARAYEKAVNCQQELENDGGKHRANKVDNKACKKVFKGTCHACLKPNHLAKDC